MAYEYTENDLYLLHEWANENKVDELDLYTDDNMCEVMEEHIIDNFDRLSKEFEEYMENKATEIETNEEMNM